MGDRKIVENERDRKLFKMFLSWTTLIISLQIFLLVFKQVTQNLELSLEFLRLVQNAVLQQGNFRTYIDKQLCRLESVMTLKSLEKIILLTRNINECDLMKVR